MGCGCKKNNATPTTNTQPVTIQVNEVNSTSTPNSSNTVVDNLVNKIDEINKDTNQTGSN